MDNKFIVIISCYVHDSINSSAVLFPTFQEAYEYAVKDASYYKHLATTYTEEVGIYKLHANIVLKGKYINKNYRISSLSYDKEKSVLDTHLNTDSDYDYTTNDIMI